MKQIALLAALLAVAACSSEGKSDGDDNDTGADSDSDADTDTDSDTDTDTDADTDVYPSCEERDGVCEPVTDTAASCPDGTYNPFSGDLAFCPGDSLSLCCVPEGGYGSPCQGEDGCDDGGCLPESSGYPAGGLCTGACDPESQGGPAWTICLPVFFSAAMGVVMLACDRDELCRESWSCQAFPLQPFESQGETTNVCWQTGIGMSTNGLGEPCAVDTDCLSQYCLQDADDDQLKCTATCDDAHPCLPGYACDQVVDCSTPGCGVCFP